MKTTGKPEDVQVPVSEVNHEATECLPRPVSYKTGETLDQSLLCLLSGLISCSTESLTHSTVVSTVSPSSVMMASLTRPIPVPAAE